MTVREFLDSLRDGGYTSTGCYPKYWLCADGGTLSYKTCVSEVWLIARAIRDRDRPDGSQWRVVACDVNWEDPDMYDDHSGDRIESAYAEPE
jgi:hypothetical protein